MICTPCKSDDHWHCPDVVRANVVRTRGNPHASTGRERSAQNDFQLRSGDCDCQHQQRGTMVNRNEVNRDQARR